jgi:hypothetical protein
VGSGPHTAGYHRRVSIELSLTPDGVGAVYKSSGLLTGQELLDADSRMHEEVLANPGIRYLLVDHGAIAEEKVDVASLRNLASRTGRFLEIIPDGMVAIVAPNDVLYGLSRMWEALVEQPGLVSRVVRTREEAVAWLRQELDRRGLPFALVD